MSYYVSNKYVSFKANTNYVLLEGVDY